MTTMLQNEVKTGELLISHEVISYSAEPIVMPEMTVLIDESAVLTADGEFMRHFNAGSRDVDAGRGISAADLEEELGL